MCSCSGCDVTYQVGGKWEQLGPEEQRGGQEAGDQDQAGQSQVQPSPSTEESQDISQTFQEDLQAGEISRYPTARVNTTPSL